MGNYAVWVTVDSARCTIARVQAVHTVPLAVGLLLVIKGLTIQKRFLRPWVLVRHQGTQESLQPTRTKGLGSRQSPLQGIVAP